MKQLFIVLLLFLFSSVTYAQERMSVGHVFNKKSRREEIRTSFYSQRADTIRFTFYCEPDNGYIEYHTFAIRNKKAMSTSAIFCPQKVVVKAQTIYSTQYDTLDVATIRKIIRGHQ